MYYIGNIQCVPSDIRHHGILGMKWGVRRYQNKDGTLTSAGKQRYNIKTRLDIKNGYRHPDGTLTREGTRKYIKADPDYKKLMENEREHSRLSSGYETEINKKARTASEFSHLWDKVLQENPKIKEIEDRSWQMAEDLLKKHNGDRQYLWEEINNDRELMSLTTMDRKQKRDSLIKEADDTWKKIDARYTSERDKEKAWNKYTNDKYAQFNKKLGSKIRDRIMYGKNGKGGFMRGESIDDIVDSLPANLQDSAYEYLAFMTDVDK